MQYCSNCGSKLDDNAKFCPNCGHFKQNTPPLPNREKKTVYEGEIHKCPYCGEFLDSFTLICPSCGRELRNASPSNAVKEFSLKLESIEANREYEKKGLFTPVHHISKADEQKISLIKSFSVPNTKEDMLEFMILASSNINLRVFDSTQVVTESQKALNDAWLSKVEQVYEKAKLSYAGDQLFDEIERYYIQCKTRIQKSKSKARMKWILLLGWLPVAFLIIFAVSAIQSPKEHASEIERLEGIEEKINVALGNGEYKEALLYAESLVYEPSVRNNDSDKIEEEWDIKRELIIDEILLEAKKNGVELEYSPKEEDISNN